MRKVTYQNFINQIKGPDDIMNNEKEDRMIVMPAYHQAVDSQNKINNTSIPVSHII